MRVSINSGAFTTLLGVSGTGAAWAMPEARWLGFSLIALSIIVFGFNIRVERSEIKVGRAKMLPYYILVASGIVFILSLLWIVMNYGDNANVENAASAISGGGTAISNLERLQNLYSMSDPILEKATLAPKQITARQFKEIELDADHWSRETELFIVKNFGEFEKSRLFDLTINHQDFPPSPDYIPEVARERAGLLYALFSMRKGVLRLIEEQRSKLKG